MKISCWNNKPPTIVQKLDLSNEKIDFPSKWGSHQHNNVWRGNRPNNSNSDLRPATRELAPTTAWIETRDWSENCIQQKEWSPASNFDSYDTDTNVQDCTKHVQTIKALHWCIQEDMQMESPKVTWALWQRSSETCSLTPQLSSSKMLSGCWAEMLASLWFQELPVQNVAQGRDHRPFACKRPAQPWHYLWRLGSQNIL